MQPYSPGDVVIVPFPFTDRRVTKRRPALVCSTAAFNGTSRHADLAMNTSATHLTWPGDDQIADLESAGLPVASVVRWKLFTLDASFIVRRAGALSPPDRASCAQSHPLDI
jgi:mRNA interferase MazF